VADGTVYFGGKDGHVYALTAATGAQVWKSPSMRSITAAPLADASIVCIQGFYGLTQAYDAKTGAGLWTISLGGSLFSTPIVTEQAVYIVNYSGVVYALA
jgi:outer membrane protein assembly factor BamB